MLLKLIVYIPSDPELLQPEVMARETILIPGLQGQSTLAIKDKGPLKSHCFKSAHLCMKSSLDISNFLEEITILSHFSPLGPFLHILNKFPRDADVLV